MSNGLREGILKAQREEKRKKQEEKRKKYEENVDPMKGDIEGFLEKLESHCLSNKTLEVEIICKVKGKSFLKFFGVPIHKEQVIICGKAHTEIEESWKKLLVKWYFTENGKYLFAAINNAASKKGFEFEYYNKKSWSWTKNKIYFSVK